MFTMLIFIHYNYRTPYIYKTYIYIYTNELTTRAEKVKSNLYKTSSQALSELIELSLY